MNAKNENYVSVQTLPEVYEETRSCCHAAWLGQCCESDCHPQSLCRDSLQSEDLHTTFSYLSLPLQNQGDYNVYLELSEDLVSSDMSIRSGLDAQHTLYRER